MPIYRSRKDGEIYTMNPWTKESLPTVEYYESLHHYARLQLEPGCSPDDIAESYKALLLLFHPDKTPGVSPDLFRLLRESNEFLSKPVNRKRLNEKLKRQAEASRKKREREEERKQEEPRKKQRQDQSGHGAAPHSSREESRDGPSTGSANPPEPEPRRKERSEYDKKYKDKKNKEDPKGRWWFFTFPLNNIDVVNLLSDLTNQDLTEPENYKFILAYIGDILLSEYICGQLEKGEGENEHDHIQFVAYFDNKDTRFSHIKTRLEKFPCVHIEKVKSIDDALIYVTKELTRIAGPWEFGRKPFRSSSARDWDNVRKLAMEGRFDDIPSEIFIRYYSTLMRIHQDYMPKPSNLDHLENLWIWSRATGNGKSRGSRVLFPDLYPKPRNKWWSGYKNEDTVLIEEVCPDDKWLGSFLKVWSDHYPFIAEVKGRDMMIRPKRIIVTSNYPIHECWDDYGIRDPLIRRFKELEVHSFDLATSKFILTNHNLFP